MDGGLQSHAQKLDRCDINNENFVTGKAEIV